MVTETSEGTLLIPVANPDTVARLLDTAIDVARGRSMEIELIHVVEVPPQLPLSEGDVLVGDDGETQRMLDEAIEQVTDAGVPAESQLRYARDVATGIVGAVDKYDADGLFMGWRGRPRRRDVVLGSFIDRVLGEASCDVFVKRIRQSSREIDSILVPVAEGPHCALAVDLVGTIAAERDAMVRLLHVAHPDAGDATIEESAELLRDYESTLDDADVDVTSTTLRNEHVAGAITDETANHDLTVLGTTRDPFLNRKLVGSVAEGVGRSASSSVILARKESAEEGA